MCSLHGCLDEVQFRDCPVRLVGFADQPRLGYRAACSQHHGQQTHREHRAVHADPERQCDHSRQREPTVFQQQPGGKSNVLPDVVHPAGSTRIAATLLQLIISAKIETCAATGLLLGHSHPDVVIHLTIEVIAKLCLELTLESVAIAKALPPVHCSPHSAA